MLQTGAGRNGGFQIVGLKVIDIYDLAHVILAHFLSDAGDRDPGSDGLAYGHVFGLFVRVASGRKAYIVGGHAEISG